MEYKVKQSGENANGPNSLGERMQVELISELTARQSSELAEFAKTCPVRTYLQDPDWPSYAPSKKRHSYQIAMVRDAAGGLVLAGVLRKTRAALGLSIGAFRRGPLTQTPDDLDAALPPLLEALKAQGVVAVTLNPRWTDAQADACEGVLNQLGATLLPDARQTLHCYTGLVDLRPDRDKLIAGLSKRYRANLRKIERMPLRFRPMTDADITLYRNWNAAFVESRDYDASGLPGPGAQVRYVREKGGVASLVELDGAPAGVVLGFADGDRILPVGNGWADPRLKLPRIVLVFWHLMEEGKRQGLRYLDVGGLSAPDAKTGQADAEQGSAEARDQPKMNFGPQVIRLTRAHEFVLRPVQHKAIRLAKSVL